LGYEGCFPWETQGEQARTKNAFRGCQSLRQWKFFFGVFRCLRLGKAQFFLSSSGLTVLFQLVRQPFSGTTPPFQLNNFGFVSTTRNPSFSPDDYHNFFLPRADFLFSWFLFPFLSAVTNDSSFFPRSRASNDPLSWSGLHYSSPKPFFP